MQAVSKPLYNQLLLSSKFLVVSMRIWISFLSSILTRFMKLVASKPARLHCPNCDATYSLPMGGGFKLYNELKCPLDDFELLLWIGGPNAKGYPFCPYCYIYPPFRYVS